MERNEAFNKFLDDMYGSIIIANIEFKASSILYWMDNIAYRCYLVEYLNSIEEEDEDA